MESVDKITFWKHAKWGNKAHRKQTEVITTPAANVKEIIRNIKNDKSGGENEMKNELIKLGGPKLEQQIVRIWNEESMPNK